MASAGGCVASMWTAHPGARALENTGRALDSNESSASTGARRYGRKPPPLRWKIISGITRETVKREDLNGKGDDCREEGDQVLSRCKARGRQPERGSRRGQDKGAQRDRSRSAQRPEGGCRTVTASQSSTSATRTRERREQRQFRQRRLMQAEKYCKK